MGAAGDRGWESLGQEFAHFERAELTVCPDLERFVLFRGLQRNRRNLKSRDQGEQKQQVVHLLHPGNHFITETRCRALLTTINQR